MHMRGDPSTMQQNPTYSNVVDEVIAFLEGQLRFAVAAGIPEERVLLDPGIGFGKTVAHNLQLLAHLDRLVALGRPVVVGTSRKSFLGRIAADAANSGDVGDSGAAADSGDAADSAGAAGGEGAVGPAARLPGTIASNVMALERGATVFRVHDVGPLRDALAVAAATLAAQ
jgi:dihydropteroate synthase